MRSFQKAVQSVIISICVLALAACGSNGGILTPKPPDMNKLFTFTANITQAEQSYSVQLDRTAAGKWQVTFTEPYTLQGVSFSYSKEGVSVDYDGISVDSLTDDFSSSFIAAMVRSLESAVQDGNGTVRYNENGFTVQSGECVLSFPKNGDKPDKFEIAKEKIHGEITDFRFNGDVISGGADVVVIE